MPEKERINLWMTKTRMNDLRLLSDKLDIPVSILIRMGASLILQKYKKMLIKISKNEDS